MRRQVAPVIDGAAVSRHTLANFGSGELGALGGCDVKMLIARDA